MGGVTAWAAWAADILSQYAPFSWIASGLGGALIVALIILMVAFGRLKWAQASATNKWRESVAAISPLEDTFRSQRIRFSDLISPIRPEIRNKTFIDCEMIGPANLAMLATRPGGGGFNGTGFVDCDWIVVKDKTRIYNGALLVDCNFLRGVVYKATFYIVAEHALMMAKELPDLQWLNPPIPPVAPSSPQ